MVSATLWRGVQSVAEQLPVEQSSPKTLCSWRFFLRPLIGEERGDLEVRTATLILGLV